MSVDDKNDGVVEVICSFCGKGQDEVKKLIAGPSVYICDECIDLCNDIVKDDRRPKSYITVGVHYPSDTDIINQTNFNNMVTWSWQMMIEFYELIQPQLEEISKNLG